MNDHPTTESAPPDDPTLVDLVTDLDRARRAVEDAEMAVGRALDEVTNARRNRGNARREYAAALARYDAYRSNPAPHHGARPIVVNATPTPGYP